VVGSGPACRERLSCNKKDPAGAGSFLGQTQSRSYSHREGYTVTCYATNGAGIVSPARSRRRASTPTDAGPTPIRCLNPPIRCLLATYGCCSRSSCSECCSTPSDRVRIPSRCYESVSFTHRRNTVRERWTLRSAWARRARVGVFAYAPSGSLSGVTKTGLIARGRRYRSGCDRSDVQATRAALAAADALAHVILSAWAGPNPGGCPYASFIVSRLSPPSACPHQGTPHPCLPCSRAGRVPAAPGCGRQTSARLRALAMPSVLLGEADGAAPLKREACMVAGPALNYGDVCGGSP